MLAFTHLRRKKVEVEASTNYTTERTKLWDGVVDTVSFGASSAPLRLGDALEDSVGLSVGTGPPRDAHRRRDWKKTERS